MIISLIFSFLLTAMSLLSLLLGLIISGIGIWLIASKNMLRSVLNLIDTNKIPNPERRSGEAEALLGKFDTISAVGAFILIIGAIIAVISVCGAVGSMMKIKILLLLYIAITGLLLIVLVSTLIYFGTLKYRLANEIKEKLTMLQENYFVSLATAAKNEDSMKTVVTAALSFMHFALKCCGISEIADSRNSPSWRASDRSVVGLADHGVPLKVDNGSTQAVPQWLKGYAPPSLSKLPIGVSSFPAELPQGFSLPFNFKEKLGNLVGANNLTANTFDMLMNQSLVIQTPISCCQLKDDVTKGKINIRGVYDVMTSPECPFKDSNDGVYPQTCHQAFLNYITRYQHFVVSTGSILAIVMGAGIFAAVWITFIGI